jgi:hypothetical protein
MTVSRILQSLEFGRMQAQGSAMSADERFSVASYLAAAGGEVRDAWIADNACKATRTLDIDAGAEDNWGSGVTNRREYGGDVTVDARNLRRLQLMWSLAIPGATEMRSQPVAASGVLFLGTSNGNLLALDQETGCVIWRFQALSSIRSSLNLARNSDGVANIFFADDLANVYAVSANDGALRWSQPLRWFPNRRHRAHREGLSAGVTSRRAPSPSAIPTSEGRPDPALRSAPPGSRTPACDNRSLAESRAADCSRPPARAPAGGD